MGSARPGDRSGEKGLPRLGRIHRGSEIRTLLRRGARRRGSHVEVFSSPSPTRLPRYGTIVPRYGRAVVERNLVRRRLREIGRIEILPRLRGEDCHADVLVRARPEAYGATFSDLRAELIRLTERLCSDASFSA